MMSLIQRKHLSGLLLTWLMMVVPLSAGDAVDQLRLSSDLAFQRGLLPVVDFLEHHAAAEEVRLQSLSDPEDPIAIRQTMQPRRDALYKAIQQLERFRQPAAEGWAADLLLLRHTLAQADLQQAFWTGDRSKISGLSEVREKIAWEHYCQRVFDAQFLGHGSLLGLIDSAALLNLSPELEISARTRAVETLNRWHQQGAGIGRSDLVRLANLQLTEAQLSIRDVRLPQAALAHYIEADHQAGQLFADQLRYWPQGTTTLAELSRSWRLRRQIQDQALWVDLDLPESSRNSLANDLTSLERLSQSIQDRRGRISSDVLYVQVLREGVTPRNP